MIALSFHNPVDLAKDLQDKNIPFLVVKSKEDTKSIKSLLEDKSETKVLMVHSVSVLNHLKECKPKSLKKVKVVVFDLPNIFFKHSIEMDDAQSRPNGVWAFKDKKEFFVELIRTTKPGVKVTKKIRKEEL